MFERARSMGIPWGVFLRVCVGPVLRVFPLQPLQCVPNVSPSPACKGRVRACLPLSHGL
jgi:hypothetical protein